MNSALEFKGVSCTARGRKLADDISFALEAGGKAVIAGPSGAGKTTLLGIAAGFVAPESGSVAVCGETEPRKFRRSIAYLWQAPLLGAETAEAALLLPFTFRANRAMRPDAAKIREALAAAQLPESILGAKAATLSGGEKQRLAIARMLLMNRPLVLADEFTAALDAENRDAIARLMISLPAAVLAVSHDEETIRAFPARYRLENGRLARE